MGLRASCCAGVTSDSVHKYTAFHDFDSLVSTHATTHSHLHTLHTLNSVCMLHTC